jgi:hypothetical protein
MPWDHVEILCDSNVLGNGPHGLVLLWMLAYESRHLLVTELDSRSVNLAGAYN